MNVLILAGRGIEGTGQTRTIIEIDGYFRKKGHNVLTIANSEKSWGRRKTQENQMVEHNFKKGLLELPKEFQKLDKIIIGSVPAANYSKESMENFTQLLEKYSFMAQVSYVQVDHKLQSIRRNYYALEEYKDRFFNVVDIIVTHSLNNDFCKKFLGANGNVNLFGEPPYKLYEMMFISCDFSSIPQSKQEEKIDKLCYFIGRSAKWKGWTVLRDFHHNHLKDQGYSTIIEGIELSIDAAHQIFEYTKPTRKPWPSNQYHLHAPREPFFEKRGEPAQLFSYYNRLEALERLGKAKFGMFYTYVGKEAGGPVENTLMEIIGTRTVPVVRREFYDVATFVGGKFLDFQPEQIGMVIYDSNYPQVCVEMMNKLDAEPDLYKKYVDNAYKFASRYFDRDRVIGNFYNILEKNHA